MMLLPLPFLLWLKLLKLWVVTWSNKKKACLIFLSSSTVNPERKICFSSYFYKNKFSVCQSRSCRFVWLRTWTAEESPTSAAYKMFDSGQVISVSLSFPLVNVQESGNAHQIAWCEDMLSYIESTQECHLAEGKCSMVLAVLESYITATQYSYVIKNIVVCMGDESTIWSSSVFFKCPSWHTRKL